MQRMKNSPQQRKRQGQALPRKLKMPRWSLPPPYVTAIRIFKLESAWACPELVQTYSGPGWIPASTHTDDSPVISKSSLALPSRRTAVSNQSQEVRARTVVRGFSLVSGVDSTALKGRTTCVFVMGLPRFPFAVLRALAHRNDTSFPVIARSAVPKQSRGAVAQHGDCHAPIMLNPKS